MAHISKSAFVKGVQCARQLYYYKNNYAERDPVTATEQEKFKRGVDVGVLAQKLFPGGRDLSPEAPWAYKQAVAITRHFLTQGEKHLYEASFFYNGLYAIMDIVVNANGRLTLYEVKNSRSVKPQHILDASFQYYVISQSGFTVDSIHIIYPNRSLDDYTEGDALTGLFEIEEITGRVVAEQNSISLQSEHFIDMITRPEAPVVAIGSQCFTPYACGFMRKCWQGAEKIKIAEVLSQNPTFKDIVAEKIPGL